MTSEHPWRLQDLEYEPADGGRERATIDGVEIVRVNGKYSITSPYGRGETRMRRRYMRFCTIYTANAARRDYQWIGSISSTPLAGVGCPRFFVHPAAR